MEGLKSMMEIGDLYIPLSGGSELGVVKRLEEDTFYFGGEGASNSQKYASVEGLVLRKNNNGDLELIAHQGPISDLIKDALEYLKSPDFLPKSPKNKSQ